jgi:hypothetical protein
MVSSSGNGEDMKSHNNIWSLSKIASFTSALVIILAVPLTYGQQSPMAFGKRSTLRQDRPWEKAGVRASQVRELSGSISIGHFGMIDFPRADACVANAINKKGKIVGGYGGDVLDTSNHGFLLQGSTFKTIDYPLATGTELTGINDLKVIVGYYNDSGGNRHGFELSGSTYTSIDVPGAAKPYGTIVWDINKSGESVGGYWDGTRAHGFLLSGGVYTTLDPPGSISTTAVGINNFGQIVGWYADASDIWHGFVLSSGTFTTVDYPSKLNTFLFGINDNGQIVGAYDMQGGFIYQSGTFTDINVSLEPSGANLPSRLNDKGALVGLYINSAGTIYGYNATVGP